MVDINLWLVLEVESRVILFCFVKKWFFINSVSCYIRLNAAHFHNGLYIVFLQVGGIPRSELSCSRWCLKLVRTLMIVVGNLEGANTIGLEFPIFICPPKDIIPHF